MKVAHELNRPKGLSYLCLYCYGEILRTGKLYIKLELDIDKGIDNKEPMHINPENLFKFGDCPHCGNNYGHFEVDTEVADAVAALNKKGYFTDYSCAGHYVTMNLNPDNTDEKYEIYDGYIAFHEVYPELQDHIKPIQAYRLNEKKKKFIGDVPLFSECNIYFDSDYRIIRFKALDHFPEVKQELLDIIDKLPDKYAGYSIG